MYAQFWRSGSTRQCQSPVSASAQMYRQFSGVRPAGMLCKEVSLRCLTSMLFRSITDGKILLGLGRVLCIRSRLSRPEGCSGLSQVTGQFLTKPVQNRKDFSAKTEGPPPTICTNRPCCAGLSQVTGHQSAAMRHSGQALCMRSHLSTQ